MKKISLFIALFLVMGATTVAQKRNEVQSVNDRRFPKEGEVFFGSYKSNSFPTAQATQDGGNPTVNNWELNDIGAASVPDSSRIRSYIDSGGGQGFCTYAVADHVIGVWSIQGTWTKKFYPNLITADTISIEARFVRGEVSKVRRISMRIAVQYGNNLLYVLLDKTIPMDSTWKTLYWDMNPIKNWGITIISRFYLSFQFYANDSSLVGGDIVVKNLRGINNGKVSDIDFSVTTGVSEHTQVPSGFVLEQNYPNPFNPSTTIQFSIPTTAFVSLKVFNMLGAEVTSLVNENRPPGTYQVTWDANGYPSGVYLYRLIAGGKVFTGKMNLVK